MVVPLARVELILGSVEFRVGGNTPWRKALAEARMTSLSDAKADTCDIEYIEEMFLITLVDELSKYTE
jgi:hypothetical protein